ncbi:MAG: MerR family transcriptional regulator [Deltaproteobacteria bacterium]|nr:MerR family transcriptional regulator [Deltaproteobacteria bacterium]
MKIAELSQRSGVPTTAIKFYLRKGLLPPGRPTAHNQADYGDRHLERLALIRALREVARFPLESIARVTDELDRALREGWSSDADPIGLALRAARAAPPRERTDEDRLLLAGLEDEVDELLSGLPWALSSEMRPFAEEVAECLVDVRRHLYPDFPVARLVEQARIAWRLSELEFEQAPGGARVPLASHGDDIAEPTRRAILASILFERIFDAFHRCANTMRATRISRGGPVPGSN